MPYWEIIIRTYTRNGFKLTSTGTLLLKFKLPEALMEKEARALRKVLITSLNAAPELFVRSPTNPELDFQIDANGYKKLLVVQRKHEL